MKREAGDGTQPVWNRRGSVSNAVKAVQDPSMANRAKNVFSYRAVLRAGVSLRGSSDVDFTLPKQCVLGKGTAAPGLTVEAMAGIHDQRLVRGDAESDGTTLAASQVRHRDFLIGLLLRRSHLGQWLDQPRPRINQPIDLT